MVVHHTGGSRSTPTVHPCPLRWEGCPHHNFFNMERQCWLLSSKSVQPACATVSVPLVMRRGKTSTRLKHTAKPMKISPVHQCRNVDDCRMHTCGPRGTCVDGVSSHSGDYDPGFRETDIDGDTVCENLDDCGDCSVVRAMETRCV